MDLVIVFLRSTDLKSLKYSEYICYKNLDFHQFLLDIAQLPGYDRCQDYNRRLENIYI